MKRTPLKRSTPLRNKKPEPRREESITLTYPKPSQVKKESVAVKVFVDGREQCNLLIRAGRDEYHGRIRKMWERQDKKCGLQISPQCKERNGRLLIDEAQFDHSYGRGMGGSKRDDRIVGDDSQPLNMAVCCWCNCLKGSRPLTDFEEIA